MVLQMRPAAHCLECRTRTGGRLSVAEVLAADNDGVVTQGRAIQSAVRSKALRAEGACRQDEKNEVF